MSTRSPSRTAGRAARVLVLLGAAAAAVGAWVEPAAFDRAWLFAFVACVGLPLGALGFAVIHGLCGGAWGDAVRRELDAMVATMPLMLVLFVPVVLGIRTLYPWAAPASAADPALAGKLWYLNATGFTARGAGALAVWACLGLLLVRRGPRSSRVSAVAAIVHVAAGTVVAVDWVMSLDPQWSSHVFGLLFLAGRALFALALAVAIAARTSMREGRELPRKTLRDLGNLLLAFLLVWAWLEFLQLLIVWNGNLPHDVPWYLRRIDGAWSAASLALAVLHFFVPFALLLFRANKEDPRRLSWIAGWLVAMRLLDDCCTVLPVRGRLHWLDVAVPLAMGGVVLGVFGVLRRRAHTVPPAAQGSVS